MMWRSVQDELPEHGERVLVYIGPTRFSEEVMIAYRSAEQREGPDGRMHSWWDDGDDCGWCDGVTFWMPLPDPP